MSLFRVAPLFGGLARFEGMKNLASCPKRGCRDYLYGNTKRGKRKVRFPLLSVVRVETLYIPLGDCFAALQLILSRFILRCGDRGEALPRL